MSEARHLTISAPFVADVRRALNHLYDPAALRGNPLIQLFSLDPDEDEVSALRQLLLSAIEALKPSQAAPAQSQEWRYYQILLHRFVEQFMQREVAHTLGLSIRQLRRQETQALRELAAYLWSHYHLAERMETANTNATTAITVSREEELAWSQNSFPSESAEAGPMLQAVAQTVLPLAKLLQVQIEYSIPEWLPQLAVQVVTVRQALLSALTTAIRLVPGGRITVAAEVQRQEVQLCISGTGQSLPSPRRQEEESIEGLAIAQQLVSFSGGRLELTLAPGNRAAFAIRIALPTVKQWIVLAIDDNPDTLALLQRYTSGTRYHLVGVREPEQTLKLAEKLHPQVIILDVMLPGIDGWELLGRLRAHPKIGHVPVVVCTVLPEEPLALALGAATFLRKPLSRPILLAALDAQVEGIG